MRVGVQDRDGMAGLGKGTGEEDCKRSFAASAFAVAEGDGHRSIE